MVRLRATQERDRHATIVVPDDRTECACAECRRQMLRRLGRSHPCRPSMVGSVCNQPNALPHQHAGQNGWTWRRSSVPLPQSADLCLEALEEGNAGGPASCLREAVAARIGQLPTSRTAYDGACPQHPIDASPRDSPYGWQHHATRSRNLYYRDRVLLPALQPASGHFCARKAGRTEGLGWQQRPVSQHSRWPTHRAARTAATTAPGPAVVPQPLRTGAGLRLEGYIDAYGDHALGCWPAALTSWGASGKSDAPPLERVHELAAPAGSSRLPLRA